MKYEKNIFSEIYIKGFLDGLASISNIWTSYEISNLKNKTIDERVKEIDNKAWTLTGQVLKDTCLDIEKKYKVKHD